MFKCILIISDYPHPEKKGQRSHASLPQTPTTLAELLF